MQLSIIAIAVRFACNEIGMQYRNRMALQAFAATKQEDKAVQ